MENIINTKNNGAPVYERELRCPQIMTPSHLEQLQKELKDNDILIIKGKKLDW